jgi:hypothetical protein
LINAAVNILDYFPVQAHAPAADRPLCLAIEGHQASPHQKLDQRHTRDSFGLCKFERWQTFSSGYQAGAQPNRLMVAS